MSTHIDTTPSGIRKHFTNVNKLKEIRHAYCGYDFFANGPVKMISTGKVVQEDVVNDLFSASMTGNECFTKFVQEHFVINQLSTNHKITKSKIKTGIAKAPKKSKLIKVIMKEVKGFGILAEQKVLLSKAFKHPVTKIPLSILESEYDL